MLGLTKKRLNIKKNIYIYLNFNRIALNCITIASLMQSRIAYKKMHMHRMSAYILFTSLLYRFLRHTYTLCVKRFFFCFYRLKFTIQCHAGYIVVASSILPN